MNKYSEVQSQNTKILKLNNTFEELKVACMNNKLKYVIHAFSYICN